MSEFLITVVSVVTIAIFFPVYLCWAIFICTKAFYTARYAAEQWNLTERTKNTLNRIKEKYQDGDRQTEA